LFEVAAPAVHRNHALEERAVTRLFTRCAFEELALACQEFSSGWFIIFIMF
jgi:hypothetical protein